MHSELSPLIVWIALWTANTYSEFQVNIFRSNRDITKYQFLHNEDDAKAIAILLVFSKNRGADKCAMICKRGLSTSAKRINPGFGYLSIFCMSQEPFYLMV